MSIQCGRLGERREGSCAVRSLANVVSPPASRFAGGEQDLCLFTYALARRLEGTGVTVNCLHPGVVATNIWRSVLPDRLRFLGLISRLFGISAERGALTSIYLASSPEVEGITGKCFAKCQAVPSVQISYDQDVQERLWTISEALTHIDR
jgi:short-subunit dehydrogenase